MSEKRELGEVLEKSNLNDVKDVNDGVIGGVFD